MPTDTLARLRELDARATKGPWHHSDERLWAEVTSRPDGGGAVIAHVPPGGSLPFQAQDDQDRATAALISSMRNALPALLTVAEAARRVASWQAGSRCDCHLGFGDATNRERECPHCDLRDSIRALREVKP